MYVTDLGVIFFIDVRLYFVVYYYFHKALSGVTLLAILPSAGQIGTALETSAALLVTVTWPGAVPRILGSVKRNHIGPHHGRTKIKSRYFTKKLFLT